MKKQINELIEKHKDSEYQKYTLKISLSDFKLLQRLMWAEYKIKDTWTNVMWKHNGVDGHPSRIGTVRFDNFELNVTCKDRYTKEPVFKAVKEVDDKFWNSKS